MSSPIHFIRSHARSRGADTSSAPPARAGSPVQPEPEDIRAWRSRLRRKIDAARETLREEELDRTARLLRDRIRAGSDATPSPTRAPIHPTD